MYITFDEIMSYKMKVEGLQAENDRLMKQVDSLRHSNSSTHTHTKEREIDALKDKHGD